MHSSQQLIHQFAIIPQAHEDICCGPQHPGFLGRRLCTNAFVHAPHHGRQLDLCNGSQRRQGHEAKTTHEECIYRHLPDPHDSVTEHQVRLLAGKLPLESSRQLGGIGCFPEQHYKCSNEQTVVSLQERVVNVRVARQVRIAARLQFQVQQPGWVFVYCATPDRAAAVTVDRSASITSSRAEVVRPQSGSQSARRSCTRYFVLAS